MFSTSLLTLSKKERKKKKKYEKICKCALTEQDYYQIRNEVKSKRINRIISKLSVVGLYGLLAITTRLASTSGIEITGTIIRAKMPTTTELEIHLTISRA